MNIPSDFEIVMHAGTISEQHNQILDYFKDKKALYIHSGKESESFSKQKDQKDLIIYDYKRIENIDQKIQEDLGYIFYQKTDIETGLTVNLRLFLGDIRQKFSQTAIIADLSGSFGTENLNQEFWDNHDMILVDAK